MITFSGTSYLGLDRHAAFISLIQEGLDRYGSHYGGSRRSPLTPKIFQEVEQKIAQWTGAPAALLLSSGTAAGQLIVRYTAIQQQSKLHFSPLVHPALHWPTGILHQSWESWQQSSAYSENTCLTDSVNPLKVSLAQWPRVASSAQAQLIADDSHLIGHYGPLASGSWRQLRSKWAGHLFVTASLGKALCMPAGVLLGEKKAIDELKELPQFGGASPPAPAYLYAWLQAGTILAEQRNKLNSYLRQIQEVVGQDERFQILEGFPVIGLKEHSWGEILRRKGIAISAFRYPGLQDELYSRIVITAGHTPSEIDYLSECLKSL
jgi:7-keto-8-aminopelargonate synthetase-like enzyme